MFKKVMVALDGSEHAEHALGVALDIAQRYEASLVLFHAIAHYAIPAGYEQLAKDSANDAFREAGRLAAQEILDKAEARATGCGLNAVHKVAVEGSDAKAIIKMAKKESVDLIVMGTRGQSGFHELVMGSVAHKVITLATCPVLVAK